MARFIDADVLKDEIMGARVIQKPQFLNTEETLMVIDNQPTADVVEVVRCKDCAYYAEMEGFDYNGRKARSCVWHSALRRENDYCSDAIRTPKERGGEK